MSKRLDRFMLWATLLCILQGCLDLAEEEGDVGIQDKKPPAQSLKPKVIHPPLFPWEEISKGEGLQVMDFHYGSPMTRLLESVEEELLSLCIAKEHGALDLAKAKEGLHFIEDVSLLAGLERPLSRMVNVRQELEFVKKHVLPVGPVPPWLPSRNRWMQQFSGENRTALEERLEKERPVEVSHYFPGGMDFPTIYNEGLVSFLNHPYDPEDKACAFLEWSSPELAIEVYGAAFRLHGETLPGIKARYRTGRLLRKLGKTGYLEHIEFAAGKGLQWAMLDAARSRKAMAGEENTRAALYWYRRLELNHSDISTSVVQEGDDFMAELETTAPEVLRGWWEELAVRDPKYMKKVGDLLYEEEGESRAKGLEFYERAATLGNPGATLALANHYLVECEKLFTKRGEEAAFFHWATRASHSSPGEGQFLLARAYEKGWGCVKDPGKQRSALLESARHGWAMAGFQLAQGYENGKWGSRDLVEALAWYDWSGVELQKAEPLRKKLGKEDGALDKANLRLAEIRGRCQEPVERGPK